MTQILGERGLCGLCGCAARHAHAFLSQYGCHSAATWWVPSAATSPTYSYPISWSYVVKHALWFLPDYMESIVSTSEIMEPPGMSRSSNPVNVQRREGYHTHNPSYIGFQWILVWLFNKGNSSIAPKGLL